MNNEETKVLSDNQKDENTKVLDNNDNDKRKDNDERNENIEKKAGIGEKVAYAAGGFAASVASSFATSAFAGNVDTNSVDEKIIVAEEATAPDATAEAVVAEPAPAPEDVLLATDEGLRIAQVDDSDSFAEAFADARQQVGPGGAFEWRGQVYNTYYAEEWDNMSAEQRAEFQAKVDTDDIAVDYDYAQDTPVGGDDIIASNAEMVDEPIEDPIEVLAVETVTDESGNTITVAAVEIEGEAALLYDVDNNGEMDYAIQDLNCDNEITDNEIIPISDGQIETSDLQQLMDNDGTGNYLAYNDDMPDYMNDADISTMA